MKTDFNWLSKWHPSLTNKRVLELGCGNGIDTKQLLHLAKELTACDRNISLIAKTKFAGKDIKLLNLDHSEPLPFFDDRFDVILAGH